MSVTVRPATPADVPAVLPMVRALCDMHEAWDAERYGMLDDVVARYERWLPQRAVDVRSVFLVAEGDEFAGETGRPLPPPRSPRRGEHSSPGGGGSSRLIGFLIATIEPNIPIYRLTEFGFIHDVWVEPEARKRGVARVLVVEALRRFEGLGVRQVRLETAAANEAARGLFASCGFRVGTVDMLATLPRPG